MDTFFKASPGRVMFWSGLFFTAFFLGQGGLMVYTGIVLYPEHWGVTVFLTLAGLALIFLAALLLCLVPRGYLVTPEAVIVRRWGPPVTVALAEIRELRRIKLPHYVKTNGANGFFGDWGQFTTYNKSLGFHDFTAYLTRNDTEVVLIRTKGEPIVLSPDQPEAFIQAVTARINA